MQKHQQIHHRATRLIAWCCLAVATTIMLAHAVSAQSASAFGEGYKLGWQASQAVLVAREAGR